MNTEFDFIVIGAGSAGCAVASGLAKANIGTVCVLEAGPSDAVPQVKIPFGLLYTMGSSRDWKFKSTAQKQAASRNLKVNRGRVLGGSSSINSMVWFRGRQDDFDSWNLDGWRWKDVSSLFDEIESVMQPDRLPDPHPLSEAFGLSLGSNGMAPPTPERTSAGVFHTNMRNGRRWSAADGFLRPAQQTGKLKILAKANVDRLIFENGKARQVVLNDGRVLTAKKGIVLSAGSIGSPAILMRSGVGPAQHLSDMGIPVVLDAPKVGENLHDHPTVGLHFAGPNSGYGLTLNQALAWAVSPLNWVLRRKGRLTSNFVEAGAFFKANDQDEDQRPDIQTHFIPYMMGYKGKTITTGSGYWADVGVCRPVSRGRLRLKSKDPSAPPDIDLGILSDARDLDVLVAAIKKLRKILEIAPFDDMNAPEVYPGQKVASDEELRAYIRSHCGTAYHPVGTLGMGKGECPVDQDLRFKGLDGLWVADASIMPSITSANTNAPSIMIGHKAAKLISEKMRR